MKTPARILYLIIVLSALFASGRCHAQAVAATTPYKFDIGAAIGMSGYIGDASSNPFKHPGFEGELSFRYLPDTRWAIRGVLSTLGLKGNTAEMNNVLPDGQAFSFTSQVYDLSARAEFNFFPYGIGETYKRLRRWTPYLVLGVGVAMSSSGGKTSVAPTLPMGMGIKFKASQRVNLGLEWTMTKAFGDHMDGEIADLNGIKTQFYRNTDWYQRISVGISFEFGKRCETCHYVD